VGWKGEQVRGVNDRVERRAAEERQGNSVNYLYQSLEIHFSGAFPIPFPLPPLSTPSPTLRFYHSARDAAYNRNAAHARAQEQGYHWIRAGKNVKCYLSES
jgi:hypothetical protein